MFLAGKGNKPIIYNASHFNILRKKNHSSEFYIGISVVERFDVRSDVRILLLGKRQL